MGTQVENYEVENCSDKRLAKLAEHIRYLSVMESNGQISREQFDDLRDNLWNRYASEVMSPEPKSDPRAFWFAIGGLAGMLMYWAIQNQTLFPV